VSRVKYELGFLSQKAAFFIVTAAKTSNLAYSQMYGQENSLEGTRSTLEIISLVAVTRSQPMPCVKTIEISRIAKALFVCHTGLLSGSLCGAESYNF
jgi:hypothetical protein